MKNKIFWAALILMVINWSSLFAQGTPCGDSGDPDVPSECPLDSWVLVLVATFLVIAGVKLYQQSKAVRTAWQ